MHVSLVGLCFCVIQINVKIIVQSLKWCTLVWLPLLLLSIRLCADNWNNYATHYALILLEKILRQISACICNHTLEKKNSDKYKKNNLENILNKCFKHQLSNAWTLFIERLDKLFRHKTQHGINKHGLRNHFQVVLK